MGGGGRARGGRVRSRGRSHFCMDRRVRIAPAYCPYILMTCTSVGGVQGEQASLPPTIESNEAIAVTEN